MSSLAQDFETATAEEIIAFAVAEHHPRLTMACSFQKEESVLVHMLSEATSDPRAFTIDTGVLFPETLETWRRFEEHFGFTLEVQDASSRGKPWTPENCCGAAKIDALERGLSDVDAWITGIRREQAITRSAAAKVEQDEKRGIWKFNPIADWSEKDIWRYIYKHDLPYHPLHDQGYSSIGCAPCTLPGSGREGRWSGQTRTECGIHE
jgi:phosphoadenosine phosphosulfate reductase